jgi:4-hydroxybenzoyl-CoA reductase subunit beta
MRALSEIELLRPATAADAVLLLRREGATALAGGTDLLPNLGRGLHAPKRLVDLAAVHGFDELHEGGTHWRLGAGITLAALASHAGLVQALPALAQAAAGVAGPAHRSVATLGGNLCQDTRCVFYNQSAWWRAANGFCLKREGSVCHVAPQGKRCHAAFEGDLAPALIAYGAEVETLGPQGPRRLALHAMYRDDGAAHLALDAGELVVAVHVPRPAAGSASAYRKQRVRGAMDFPLAGVAVCLRREGGALAALSIGLTGTDSRPLLLQGTETLLGRAPDEALLREIGKRVQQQVHPMRSTVTAAHHRRLVAAVTAQRLVQELCST